jgi:protein SERAC1
VFVHGLTGKQVSTWRMKSEEKSWPETLLSKSVPEARILAFGYDADIAGFVQVAGLNRVANHASNLLGRLANLRDSDDSNDRPIIFVAHSLGGLVVEDVS